MARPPIQELLDHEVTAQLDRELRALLNQCFTGPEDEVFAYRRYWKEPPTFRWIMRNAGGDLIAHLAAHDKVITVRAVGATEAAGVELRIAGIAEVCVHPAARGMGHVKELLYVAHPSLAKRGFDFGLLFGRPGVYRSSGYRVAENRVRYFDDRREEWKTETFADPEEGSLMCRPLTETEWPAGVVDLGGPKF